MSLFGPKSKEYSDLNRQSISEIQTTTEEVKQEAEETKQEVQTMQAEPFSGSAPGLVPASDDNTQAQFLRGDGSWATPSGGGGGGTSDYSDLVNKPAIDGTTLDKHSTTEGLGLAKKTDLPDMTDYAKKTDIPDVSGFVTDDDLTDYAKKTDIPTVPSKTSQLQNDSGYITSETDPTVPAWAKQQNKPSYNITEMGDVTISSPTDGQVVSYDETSGKWKNANASGGDTSKCFKTDDTAETALADNDTVPFYDTSASGKRKSTWSNIKSVLKTYFDTLYNKYTLPTASASTLGGVKIGSNMSIDDGVINPIIPVLGSINRSDIYDTTEKVVGKWTDGRPVYQKTISCGALANATTKEVAHGISNLGTVVQFYGLAYNSTTDQWIALPTPFYISEATPYYDVSVIITSTKIQITTARNWSASTTSYVTIRYTKTTDSANSYNYADENDYSTSEKVVGTWIDGSKLYQKTISLGTLLDGTTTTLSVPHGISNLKDVVSIEGIAISSSTNGTSLTLPDAVQGLPVQTYNSTSVMKTNDMRLSVSNGNVTVNASVDRSSFKGYVTLKYTKTS